jgi:hypothetical protein
MIARSYDRSLDIAALLAFAAWMCLSMGVTEVRES